MVRGTRDVPQVTLVMAVDMSELVRIRGRIPVGTNAGEESRPTLTAIIAKAAATAIPSQPIINSYFDGKHIRICRGIHLNIAVATEWRMINPVVRNAERKKVARISEEIKELCQKARANTLRLKELQGGTFTVTNLGPYGIEVFDPIVSLPQTAVLGVGAISERPVVVDGRIESKPMMKPCLTLDHRVMDGVQPPQFLMCLRQLLESPAVLLQ